MAHAAATISKTPAAVRFLVLDGHSGSLCLPLREPDICICSGRIFMQMHSLGTVLLSGCDHLMERLPGNLQIHGFGRKLDVSTIIINISRYPRWGFVWSCSIVGISDVEAGRLSVGLPSPSLSLYIYICIYICIYILYSISNLFNSIYI